MNIVLINCYELGRQPFFLAHSSALLKRAGFAVKCIDLSLQNLDPTVLEEANFIGVYVSMHTAARIAVEAIPRIKQLAPSAYLCVFGLYATVNQAMFRQLGANAVLAGEFETPLLDLALKLKAGVRLTKFTSFDNLEKIEFLRPDRSGLPPLSRYAHLKSANGERKTVGFCEASRGCKHLCRHCPVVPVYGGRFYVVPIPIVMDDIAQQVDQGAVHISFGDPDFFNGPTHAVRLLQAMQKQFPSLTYDVTIKIQHIIAHKKLLPILAETGCLFVTCAVESVDDAVTARLAKGHSAADFGYAVRLLKNAGLTMAPTFIPFTPWTTFDGYIDLLRYLLELDLVQATAPVQLSMRLLVPHGSQMLQLPGFAELLDDYDQQKLGYPWRHGDPAVDDFQRTIQSLVEQSEQKERARGEIFREIWTLVHLRANRPLPPLTGGIEANADVYRLSEPWYCCAEPTSQQLAAF